MSTLSLRKLRVPLKYLAFVPAIYFMLLGLYDIGDAWLDGEVTWSHVLFNAVLLVPIVFRKRSVYLICGVCFSMLSLYGAVGGMIEIPRTPGITRLEIAMAFLFLNFSLLCSLSLWYVGVQPRLPEGE